MSKVKNTVKDTPKTLGDELVDAATEFADDLQAGRKLTRRTAVLVEKAKPLTARQIASVRKSFSVSQPVFAEILNVSSNTVKSWEQGTKSPAGAALRLLGMVRRKPEMFMELMDTMAGIRRVRESRERRRMKTIR